MFENFFLQVTPRESPNYTNPVSEQVARRLPSKRPETGRWGNIGSNFAIEVNHMPLRLFTSLSSLGSKKNSSDNDITLSGDIDSASIILILGLPGTALGIVATVLSNALAQRLTALLPGKCTPTTEVPSYGPLHCDSRRII